MLCFALRRSMHIALMSNTEQTGYCQRLGFRSTTLRSIEPFFVTRIEKIENFDKDLLQAIQVTHEIHYANLDLSRLFITYWNHSFNNPDVAIYSCDESKRKRCYKSVKDSCNVISDDSEDISIQLRKSFRAKISHCRNQVEIFKMTQKLSVSKLPDMFKKNNY